ncbi:uncharacterized protein LOC126668090 [Mercurialis annua]|uniref:uncharacterized protein LOC126668090 n=1 Tax=Mercurialis annua TaxID=3986 RepID=UPI002160EC53|nr:uncharacterized protein LOC126668090 [Mercurialis annua]
MKENSLCNTSENSSLDDPDPNGSTKKVKIRSDNENSTLIEDSAMEVESNPSSPEPENHSPKASFKDKLLNSDKSSMDVQAELDPCLSLSDEDVEFGDEKGIPVINFSDRVHNFIAHNMKLCVIIRLLGKNIGYQTLYGRLMKLWKPKDYPSLVDLDNNFFLVRFYSMDDYINAVSGGPWVLFGHYLTVQPWSPSFSSDNTNATAVTAWVRFPGLPFQYYHNHILKAIAKTIGNVIRIDYNTEAKERGKFARIAINLDLTKPLISTIVIDGRSQRVEYEGLPIICFECGRYGHRETYCPYKNPIDAITGQGMTAPVNKNENPATMDEDGRYGPWMQVNRRRRNVENKGNNLQDNSKKSAGSRFGSLADLEEEDQGPSIINGKNAIQITKSSTAINDGPKRNLQKAQDIPANEKGKNKMHIPSLPSSKSPADMAMHPHAFNVPSGIDLVPGAHVVHLSNLTPSSTSLDPCKHSAVSASIPSTSSPVPSSSKAISAKGKLTTKNHDKAQSQWKVKINRNSKGSVKVRKKRESSIPLNTTIQDLISEMSNSLPVNSAGPVILKPDNLTGCRHTQVTDASHN